MLEFLSLEIRDPHNPQNYETREVPEMEMLVPYKYAENFSSQVQQASTLVAMKGLLSIIILKIKNSC